MQLFGRVSRNGSFLFLSVGLIILLNLGQYALGFGIVSADGWDVNFGFPFSYYEYIVVLNRGRVLYLGVIGNLLFSFIVGLFASIIVEKLRHLWGS